MNRTLWVVVLVTLLTFPVRLPAASIPHSIDSPGGAPWAITDVDGIPVVSGTSPTTLTLETGVYLLHAAGASIYREDRLRRADLEDVDHTLHIGLAETDVHPPSAEILDVFVGIQYNGCSYGSGAHAVLSGIEQGETRMLPGMVYTGEWEIHCSGGDCLVPTPTPLPSPTMARSSPDRKSPSRHQEAEAISAAAEDPAVLEVPGDLLGGDGPAPLESNRSERSCCGDDAVVDVDVRRPGQSSASHIASDYCTSSSATGQPAFDITRTGMFTAVGPPLRDLDSVDTTAPSLVAIERFAHNASRHADYHIEFDEYVEGLRLEDFQFETTGTVTLSQFALAGSGKHFRLKFMESGTLGFYSFCLSTNTQVRDLSGNPLELPEDACLTFDYNPPVLEVSTYDSEPPPGGAPLRFAVTASEPIRIPELSVVRLFGTASATPFEYEVSPLPGGQADSSALISITPVSGTFPDGTIGILVKATDLFGLVTEKSSPYYTLDFQPPVGTWTRLGPARTNDPAQLRFRLRSDSPLVGVAPGCFAVRQNEPRNALPIILTASSTEWTIGVSFGSSAEPREDVISIEALEDLLFDEDGLSMPSTISPAIEFDPIGPEVSLGLLQGSASLEIMTVTFRVSAPEPVDVQAETSQVFGLHAEGFEVLGVLNNGTEVVDVVVGDPGSDPRTVTVALGFPAGSIKDSLGNPASFLNGANHASYSFIVPTATPSPTTTPTPTFTPVPSTPPPTPTTPAPTPTTPAPTATSPPTITTTPESPTPPPTPTVAMPTATATPIDTTATPTPLKPTSSPTVVPTFSPTATTTPSQTPSPVPTDAPGPIVTFEFEAGSDGWSAAAPLGFTAPIAQAANGALVLRVSDNTNTFGFWESPLQPAVMGVGWMEVRARVASSLADPERVPVLRLRASNEDFSRSDVFAVSSTGGSPVLSPTTAREFRYFAAVDGTPSRFDFDVLNFDPNDSADCWLALERLEARVVDPGDGVAVASFNFADGQSRGFTARTTELLGQPAFEAGVQGLAIRAVAAHEALPQFGYWGLESSIAMQAGLHELRWTVRGSASTDDGVPTARLRVNDSTLQWSAYANIEAEGSRQLVQADGSPATIRMLVEVPEAIAGANWVVSFDFLLTDGTASPERGLTLESLEVRRIDQ